MIAVAMKAEPMSFVRSPYLERIEWTDGTRSYCRKCDATVAFKAVGNDSVACDQGHKTHPGNLIINGMRGAR